MLARLEPDAASPVRLFWQGAPLLAQAGDTVAAALLAAGVVAFRETQVSGAARGPWCLMGVCFDCLVTIDEVANRRACRVGVVEGMRVTRQIGARALVSPREAPA